MQKTTEIHTINAKEIEKFNALASKWWDESGPMKPLHQFNPIRIEYIRNQLIQRFDLNEESYTPLTGLQLLDVGCGGGLLSEPLSRLGATVTGIDAANEPLLVAQSHAKSMGLNITYVQSAAETYVTNHKEKFDVVCAMEIIEHVANVESFLAALYQLTKPGGIIIIATLNRTIKSLVGAKIAAEYILQFVPRGTHTWQKFLKPSDIATPLVKLGMEVDAIQGFKYSLLTKEWTISKDISINYALLATKPL